MKIIFYFFLSLNFLFLLVQTQVSGERTAPVKIKSSGAPTLVLLTEAKSSAKKPKVDKPIEASNTQKPKPKQVLVACYSMGPFENRQQTKLVSETLASYGALTYTQKKREQVSSGYWVYLPAFKTWNDARAEVDKLEKQGMLDIFIMGRGKMKNAVSLGLFSNKNAANKRMGELKKLGVSPKVEVQYRTNDNYWIDIDVEKGKNQIITSIESVAKKLTLLELNKRKCG